MRVKFLPNHSNMALAEMASPEDATTALVKTHGHTIEGRRITVSFSRSVVDDVVSAPSSQAQTAEAEESKEADKPMSSAPAEYDSNGLPGIDSERKLGVEVQDSDAGDVPTSIGE